MLFQAPLSFHPRRPAVPHRFLCGCRTSQRYSDSATENACDHVVVVVVVFEAPIFDASLAQQPTRAGNEPLIHGLLPLSLSHPLMSHAQRVSSA